MKQKNRPYLYFLFFLSFSSGIFCQELELKITSKDSRENKFLQSIDFFKKHSNKNSINSEVSSILAKVQQSGYFTPIVDSVHQQRNVFTAYFSLGYKTNIAALDIIKNSNINKKYIRIEKLTSYIDSINNHLDKKGASFSEVKLENFLLKKDTLFGALNITESQKRNINKIIVKGYDKFPRSFLKYYFGINKNKTFSKNQLEIISAKSQLLPFAEEIRKPQTLFTKDSTILYLYLKKKNSNSVDAIVNFANKNDDSGLLLNGNIDLHLNNVFNSGENLRLFWNQIANQNSQLELSTRNPYIFKSPIYLESAFNLYRQDSSFVNTEFSINTGLPINELSNVGIGFYAKSSNNLDETKNLQVDYSSSFFTAFYEYVKRDITSVFTDKFGYRLQPFIGQRKTDINSVNQLAFKFKIYRIFELNQRSYIYANSVSEILTSDSYLTNEIYRIGGANSIRGFNEQSIFTNRYSYLNLEYRFVTSNTNYLYTISDLGLYNNMVSNTYDFIQGLGFGYSFSQKNNQINLGYVVGFSPNQSFNFNDSKLIISIKSNF